MNWTGPFSNRKNRRNAGIKARSLIEARAPSKLFAEASFDLQVVVFAAEKAGKF
jgi:hypothetical protein